MASSLLTLRFVSRRLPFAAALLLLLFFAVPAALAEEDHPLPAPLLLERVPGELVWRAVAPGLESLELQLGKQKTSDSADILTIAPASAERRGNMAILRSDPARCEYSLHMASESGKRRSLRVWAQEHGLDAVINAGMFLPDNLKNTGFMRNATHVNNPRIVSSFGAFFLAEPQGKSGAGAARALLTEKSELGDKLAQKIADYAIVVQNYRLTNARGEILWPESHKVYSISALGRDKQGRILFIMAEYPLSAPDFARLALSLPLEVDLMMYLEGGTQAGLAIAGQGEAEGAARAWRVWRGRHGFLSGLGGPDEVELPNVLGVRSLARP